jgi:hypothetical protein
MNYRELHQLIHRLWTRAVGTPEYNKKDWLLLEAELTSLSRATGQNLNRVAPRTADEEPARRVPSVWELIKNPAL